MKKNYTNSIIFTSDWAVLTWIWFTSTHANRLWTNNCIKYNRCSTYYAFPVNYYQRDTSFFSINEISVGLSNFCKVEKTNRPIYKKYNNNKFLEKGTFPSLLKLSKYILSTKRDQEVKLNRKLDLFSILCATISKLLNC